MGSAFVGNKIYPIVGGAEVTVIKEEPLVSKDEDPDLKKAIMDGFNLDEEFSNNLTLFLKTPVILWSNIASTPQELRQKFMKTLTHPNLNKCPESLTEICKLVSIKYSNMKDFIDKKDYSNLGDQTLEAQKILSRNSST
jgi:hypothetical protein